MNPNDALAATTARMIDATDTRLALAAAFDRQRADDAARTWIMPSRPADRSRNAQRTRTRSTKRKFIR